ncbi:MAG: TetR/AcrR family transcriptional regulator [Acidobacteria bacterium]|nr:TetR/AcrR family transcriptional regulator [Acidobacteriota bacterium]
MKQNLKSERSRRIILDAALDLFSHRGYRATSIRDIASRAVVSTGNVYHHFPDKEAIYRTLFDEYWQALSDPDFPVNKALAAGIFPDNLEALGKAAERSVRRYRRYVALIYVDVVEFDGSHIRRFYSDMAARFERFLEMHGKDEIEARLRPEVSAVSAMMLATRVFLNYFSVEVLFGVKDHFGKASDETIAEIAGILRRGMLRDGAADLPEHSAKA